MGLNKKILLFVPLIIICVRAQYPTIDEYIVMFNRTYALGTPEYNFRKGIYEERLDNFSQIIGFQPGVNNLTDRTPDQIEQMKGYRPLHGLVAGGHIKVKSTVNASLDWRDEDAVTSIKFQGKCGSCWSFASVAYFESYLITQYQYSKYDLDLSQQFVLECSLGSSCSGGYTKKALSSILSFGITTQQEFPYDPFNKHVGICQSGYKYVENENDVAIKGMSDEQIITLLQTSPVATSVAAYQWQYYSSGILSCPSDVPVDHAVLIIGYTPDYWIIKNSWDKTWGERGYARITRNTSNNCRIGYQVNYFQKNYQKNTKWLFIILTFLLIGMIF